MTDEEARAKAWCDARRQQKEWRRANAVRLAGNPSAAKALCENWKPVLSFLRERGRYGAQED